MVESRGLVSLNLSEVCILGQEKVEHAVGKPKPDRQMPRYRTHSIQDGNPISNPRR